MITNATVVYTFPSPIQLLKLHQHSGPDMSTFTVKKRRAGVHHQSHDFKKVQHALSVIDPHSSPSYLKGYFTLIELLKICNLTSV